MIAFAVSLEVIVLSALSTFTGDAVVTSFVTGAAFGVKASAAAEEADDAVDIFKDFNQRR